MPIYNIKNLSIINLNIIFEKAIKSCCYFCVDNSIFRAHDISQLVKHFFFKHFLETYECREKQNVLIYFFEESKEKDQFKVIEDELNDTFKSIDVDQLLFKNFMHRLIGYCQNKALLNLLKNKFKFNTVCTNIPIDNYINIIISNSPEYDEAVNNNFNFIDSFSILTKYIAKNKLLAIGEKYSSEKAKINLLVAKQK